MPCARTGAVEIFVAVLTKSISRARKKHEAQLSVRRQRRTSRDRLLKVLQNSLQKVLRVRARYTMHWHAVTLSLQSLFAAAWRRGRSEHLALFAASQSAWVQLSRTSCQATKRLSTATRQQTFNSLVSAQAACLATLNCTGIVDDACLVTNINKKYSLCSSALNEALGSQEVCVHTPGLYPHARAIAARASILWLHRCEGSAACPPNEPLFVNCCARGEIHLLAHFESCDAVTYTQLPGKQCHGHEMGRGFSTRTAAEAACMSSCNCSGVSRLELQKSGK